MSAADVRFNDSGALVSDSELCYNSPKTAIHRSGISAPLRYILGLKPGFGRVFHQGPGRKDNPDRKRLRRAARSVVEYDPGHGPSDRSVLRNGDCDQAISLYVLNVLPPKGRRSAVLDILHTLKPGGTAYVAVRSQSELASHNNGWQECEDGFLVVNGTVPHFQRGFAAGELKEELSREFASVYVFNEGGFILASAQKW